MNSIPLNPPCDVRAILLRLLASGYEAYYVGGCVRDSLRRVTPNDWDITTSALPEQIAACFPEHKKVTKGIAHGTLGLITNSGLVEVTTFRVDGNYTDARHPDRVSFSRSLHQDLARRDFTVNALAADIHGNITDDYGGVTDIEQRIIRCVGDPVKRFHEDALRILRALRFASTLSFSVAPETAEAARQSFSLLAALPYERLRAEIDRLLQGDNAVSILTQWQSELLPYLPLPTDQRTLSALLRRYGAVITRALTNSAKDSALSAALEEYIAEQELLPLSSLAVNGMDLRQLGLQGPQIGKALRFLLDAVRNGTVENEKNALLTFFSEGAVK